MSNTDTTATATESHFDNADILNANEHETKATDATDATANGTDATTAETEVFPLPTVVQEEYRVATCWEDIVTNTQLLRSVYGYGFEHPSPIQAKAILPILDGRDLIAQAQSGTGKTGAFTIASLAKLDLTNASPQVLILAPTRELVQQIAFVIKSLSESMDNVVIKTMVGGTTISEDIKDLNQHPPHVIVGCPGRVYDMIKRSHLNPNDFTLVVLDEADEMLSAVFKEQMYAILNCLNKSVQIALFSATLPSHFHQITSRFMRNPVHISVKSESLTLDGIKQYFVAVADDRQKYLTLKDLYHHFTVSQCIIYANSIKRVIDLYNAMKADGFPVCCLHSKMEQSDRDRVFKEFKSGASRVLISSNVTSRGIDIQQVGIVINFDLSHDVHTYLHRIGRSGRWGRKGTGINFVTRRDISTMKDIEKYYATEIEELPADVSLCV